MPETMVYERQVICAKCGKKVILTGIFFSAEAQLWLESYCKSCHIEGGNWLNLIEIAAECRAREQQILSIFPICTTVQ